jgi:hypothetical protein
MPELAMPWDVLKAHIDEAAVNLRRSASRAELGKLLTAGRLQVRDQSVLAAGSLQVRGQSAADPWVESCLARLTAAPAASPTMAKFPAPQVMGMRRLSVARLVPADGSGRQPHPGGALRDAARTGHGRGPLSRPTRPLQLVHRATHTKIAWLEMTPVLMMPWGTRGPS